MFHEIASLLDLLNELCNREESLPTRYKKEIQDRAATYQFILNLVQEKDLSYLSETQSSIINERIRETNANIKYVATTVSEEV